MQYNRPSKVPAATCAVASIRTEEGEFAKLIEPLRKSNQHSIGRDETALGKIGMDAENVRAGAQGNNDPHDGPYRCACSRARLRKSSKSQGTTRSASTSAIPSSTASLSARNFLAWAS